MTDEKSAIQTEIETQQAELLRRAESVSPLPAKLAIVAVALILIVAIGVGAYYYTQHYKAVLMAQEQIKNAAELSQQLNVSQQEGEQLRQEIEKARSQPPDIRYVVQERTVEKAAEQVKKDIDNGKSPANAVPADKTVVTPNNDEQKVDVYRITLDKPRGIGVYASTESAGAMVQYKNVIVFGGPKYSGGYEVGAAWMVRF